jgi:hypothetical protein
VRYGWLFIVAGSVGLSLIARTAAQEKGCTPHTSLDVVVTPKVPDDECHPLAVLEHIAAYSWQTFIALNWPAASESRGEPDGDDPKQIENRTSPRVWETWKSVQETFIADGLQPEPWGKPETHTVCSNSNQLEPSPTKVLADLNQSGLSGQAIGPLIAQNRTYVRYEVRMHRKGFEKIVSDKLFLRRERNVELPDGSINVKAAWREVRPGENTDRYYRTEALALDPHSAHCEKRSFVLIGMHIVHKTPQRRQWIWSTFEHVDNLAVGPDAPPGTTPSLNNPNEEQILGQHPDPVDGSNRLDPYPKAVQVVISKRAEPGPDEEAQNAKWQKSQELENTIWKFYKLIRTQWPAKPRDDGLGTPLPMADVANSTMETYQQDHTCMRCHFNSGTDFSWFIHLRANPIPPEVRSNARIFYNTMSKFSKKNPKPLGKP